METKEEAVRFLRSAGIMHEKENCLAECYRTDMDKPTLEQTLQVIKIWKWLKDNAAYCCFDRTTAELILKYWNKKHD